ETKLERLSQPPFELTDAPQLTPQTDLTDERQISGDRSLTKTAGNRGGDGQIGGRLADLQAADDVDKNVLVVERKAHSLPENSKEEIEPVMIDSIRRAPGHRQRA